ncbi:MAG: hypothetical protein ACKVJ7_07005, partial [Candidatus Poseidoniales archaeon]
QRKVKGPKVPEGPFMAINQGQIISLASGEIDLTTVRWRGKEHRMYRCDGIQALVRLHGREAWEGHSTLIEALMDDDIEVRCAGLLALPHMAEQRSDELFDHLSVLLDDDSSIVRKAAGRCLALTAPVFPSATESILANELRHHLKIRCDEAWRGLSGLCETWPEVAGDHIDELLLEEDVELRRKASGLLRKIVHKKDAMVWDLVGWALADEDAGTRRNASRCLPGLAKKAPKVAIILAEKAIFDSDPKVVDQAIRCIEALDTDHGRARDLVINGCSNANVSVRLACINILPRLMSDEVLRDQASELLRDEKNPKVIKELNSLLDDVQWSGTESQKNAFLAPAPSVPQVDREIVESQGGVVGLEPLPKKEDLRHD